MKSRGQATESRPYVQQQMFLALKSTQNQRATIEYRERFGRGSFGVDPKLVARAVSSSSERRKMIRDGRSS